MGLSRLYLLLLQAQLLGFPVEIGGKITTFKQGHPVSFYGGIRWCMFLSEWREFSSAPCLAEKK